MQLFLLFLLCAVWQDSRTRKIRKTLLWGFGLLGAVYCMIQGRELLTVLISSSIGLGILILSRLSEGGIGEGDGWFFIVAGLFINPAENFLLFLSGIFLCGIFGVVLAAAGFIKGRQVRKLRLPFLPFLVPAGIWFLIS